MLTDHATRHRVADPADRANDLAGGCSAGWNHCLADGPAVPAGDDPDPARLADGPDFDLGGAAAGRAHGSAHIDWSAGRVAQVPLGVEPVQVPEAGVQQPLEPLFERALVSLPEQALKQQVPQQQQALAQQVPVPERQPLPEQALEPVLASGQVLALALQPGLVPEQLLEPVFEPEQSARARLQDGLGDACASQPQLPWCDHDPYPGARYLESRPSA